MKYRKKPVVIEAFQLPSLDDRDDEENGFTEWAIRVGFKCDGDNWDVADEDVGDIVINTLEGPLLCRVGDWIIKGIKGEFYSCKPDIFALTYEPVGDMKP